MSPLKQTACFLKLRSSESNGSSEFPETRGGLATVMGRKAGVELKIGKRQRSLPSAQANLEFTKNRKEDPKEVILSIKDNLFSSEVIKRIVYMIKNWKPEIFNPIPISISYPSFILIFLVMVIKYE